MATTSQWWIRHVQPNTSAARFSSMQDGLGASSTATESLVKAPLSSPGNLLKMVVRLTAAPGAGKSWRIQVSINGTPSTSLDVTISDAATTGSVTATVAVSAGDLITLKMTPSGTPASANIQIATEFDPSTANNYVYPCWYGGGQVKGTAGAYNRLLFGNDSDKTTNNLANSTRDIAPFAGTITRFYVNLSVAPGVGKSWEFAIMVNGVEDASSVLTISGTNTTANLTGLSIAVSAGDQLTFELKTASGTPSNTRIMWSTTFVPTNAGLFAIGTAASTSRSTGVYYAQYGQLSNEDATEANVQTFSPADLRLKAVYAAVGAAAGSGKSWTFRQRINGADGSLAATLNNTTAGNDTSHTDTVAAGDLLAVQLILAGSSPTSTSGQAFAIAATTAPAGASHQLVDAGLNNWGLVNAGLVA